jgi:alkylation response protein AidB-like acyl-CoA dehydrogenase
VHFRLSDEQNMLRDTAARFLEGLPTRPLADRALWGTMADMGWLGAGFSESEGGFGGGPAEVGIVMEMAGRVQLRAPLIEAMVLGARVLVQAPNAEALAQVLDGSRLELPALLESGTGHKPLTPRTRLSGADGAQTLSGVKFAVPFAAMADGFIVSATDAQGALVLLRIAADADGLSQHARRLMDGTQAADLTFDRVAVCARDIVCRGNAAQTALAEALDHATAALCAEAVGVAGALHDRTLEYLKTRTQFGQPIGAFQALQHRMADLTIALEEARSLAMMANHALSGRAGLERDRLLSAAKQGVCARTMHIGREAIQMHGGIGMTEDLPVGSGFRRLKMLSLGYGDEGWHLDRIIKARTLNSDHMEI